jgi:hypothetical protein
MGMSIKTEATNQAYLGKFTSAIIFYHVADADTKDIAQ